VRVLWNRLWLSLIHHYRQGEILARKEKKCYPEWVVFFIYTNMALSQSPSAVPEIQEKTNLSNEAQARVDRVANVVIVALDKNLDAQNAIKDIFGKMVAENLRDPVSV
jgi:hypothetical protein